MYFGGPDAAGAALDPAESWGQCEEWEGWEECVTRLLHILFLLRWPPIKMKPGGEMIWGLRNAHRFGRKIQTMFSRIFQAGQTEVEIKLDTRAGIHIPNGVSSSPPIDGKFLEWSDIKQEHPDWIERKLPCGIYNCFGLVFASRRTCVYDPPLVDKILGEDRFEKISQSEVKVGDLVVYRNERVEAVHAGRIVGVKLLPAGEKSGEKRRLHILSKWGPHGGESFHLIFDLPKELYAVPTLTEYWTDRNDK